MTSDAVGYSNLCIQGNYTILLCCRLYFQPCIISATYIKLYFRVSVECFILKDASTVLGLFFVFHLGIFSFLWAGSFYKTILKRNIHLLDTEGRDNTSLWVTVEYCFWTLASTVAALLRHWNKRNSFNGPEHGEEESHGQLDSLWSLSTSPFQSLGNEKEMVLGVGEEIQERKKKRTNENSSPSQTASSARSLRNESKQH